MSLLLDNNISKGLTVVDNHNKLVELLSYKDIKKMKNSSKTCKDLNGHLRVAAAVGTKTNPFERVDELIKTRVSAIAIDPTHGRSLRVIEVLKEVKNTLPYIDKFRGSIPSSDTVTPLVNSGTDGVETKVGASSICTERVFEGVGVLQLSAIFDMASVLNDKKDPKIANEGIRCSDGITKAIAACAHSKMIGSLFAEVEKSHFHDMDITHEAPN